MAPSWQNNNVNTQLLRSAGGLVESFKKAESEISTAAGLDNNREIEHASMPGQ